MILTSNTEATENKVQFFNFAYTVKKFQCHGNNSLQLLELKEKNSICHLADLTIKAGMETLLVDIDQLFVNIFYFFFHSSKRKQQFADNWCSFFTSEPETILKHCTTRWLSLLRCVDRYLSQYDGLKSYFLSCDESESSKVQGIVERLENPLTKPLLLFLSLQWIDSIGYFKNSQRTPHANCITR